MRTPFIAPMKIHFLKTKSVELGLRYCFALLTLVSLICVGLTTTIAQLDNTKRVTSVLLGDAPEGARVTIVSDGALNDYEAFRRGDRFYVRVPLADFAAAHPSFRGDGFDDVQVQKVGDSVVISFKLQPGASARVDQKANRLEVTFSAPQRIARNPDSNVVRERVTSSPVGSTAAFKPQSRGSRHLDTAGPLPPASPTNYPSRSVNEIAAGTTPTSRRSGEPETGSESNKSTTLTKTTTPQDSVAGNLPTTSSPYNPSLNSPNATPRSQSSSSTTTDLKSRRQRLFQWVSANRKAVALGALALLSVIAVIALVRYGPRRSTLKAKHSKSPGVQPKFSPATEWDDLLADPFDVPSSRTQTSQYVNDVSFDDWQSGPYPVPVADSDVQAASPDQEIAEDTGRVTDPNLAPLEGTLKDDEWVPSKPSLGSPIFSSYDSHSENQEREVFEL